MPPTPTGCRPMTGPPGSTRPRSPSPNAPRVQVCGIVLHASPEGHLDDLVLWLTVQPENHELKRSIVYGWLSRSMLRHVGVNLAAAVAWGQWTVPRLGQ